MSEEYDNGKRDALALALAFVMADTSLPPQEGRALLGPALSLLDVDDAYFAGETLEDLQRQLEGFAHRMSDAKGGLVAGMSMAIRQLAQSWRSSDPSADPEALIRALMLAVAKGDDAGPGSD